MQIKDYDLEAYRLHIIKSDKVKTCHMEIHFRDKVNKDNIYYKSMIADMLSDCSSKHENRKKVVENLEELYKASFYGTVIKLGAVVDNIFVFDFINSNFIKEKNYLNEVLLLPFDMILKPKVLNKTFDPKIFEVIKKRAITDIEGINENPVRLSITNSLAAMDKDSISSISVLGSIEEVQKSTADKLYKEYKNMIKNSFCDIFIIGDLDFDEVYKIVTNKFKLDTIKTGKLDLYVENKLVKLTNKVSEKSSFVQSNLNILFNLDNLTMEEKNTTLQVFNYIFGSGGITSKLYQKIREENSLCYGIYSIFLKNDNLLIVQISLDEKNKNKAIKLVKDCLKEMIKGKFNEGEFEDAKTNLLTSLKMANDNNISILSNYIFNVFDNLPTIEKRMEDIKKVTIEDIKTVAKKVKLNTIYTLKSKEDKK